MFFVPKASNGPVNKVMALVEAENQTGRLFQDDGAAHDVEPEPAIFRWDVEPEIAMFSHQFQGFSRHRRPFALGLKCDRAEFSFGETASRFLELALFVGQAVITHDGPRLAREFHTTFIELVELDDIVAEKLSF